MIKEGMDRMSDYISKQSAIEGFYEMSSNTDYLCTVEDYVHFLESLSSADVQPVRHERWTKIDVSGLASCGCGYITDRYSVFNYCPHCGARMDEVT